MGSPLDMTETPPSFRAGLLRGLLRAWCLLAALGLPLAAQIRPAFRHISLREGLPQSQVTVLLEDRKGFLWLGTNAGGVARIGATAIRAFGSGEGLQARQVSALHEDDQGGIWVGSRDEGVSVIRGNRVINFGPAQGLQSLGCLSIAPAPGGGVAVASLQGVWIGRGDRFTHLDLGHPLDQDTIVALAMDAQGRLWVLGRRGVAGTWDGQRFEPHTLPPGWQMETGQTLTRDRSGRIHAVGPEAVLRWEDGRWIPLPMPTFPKGARIQQLSFDTEGRRLLALGDDGLWVEEAPGRGRFYTQASGLPKDKINVALRDRHGVLWVGSDGDGLACLPLPALGTLRLDPQRFGGSLGAVMNFLELAPGHMLLVSSQGLFELRKDEVVARWTRKEGLPSSNIWCLASDRQGGAWVGTDLGLARWRQGRILPYPAPPDFQTAVTTLRWDGDRLCAGTDRGVFVLDRDGRLIGRHAVSPEVGLNFIGTLLPFQGHLLVGLTRGVGQLEGDHVVPAFQDSPTRNTYITALADDAAGRLWVGTSRGLWIHRAEGWRAVGMAEGLPDDFINFLLDLPSVGMFVGHGKGVTLLRGERRIHLTESAGLVSNETNTGSILRDSQGRVWIGLIGGANILDLNAPLRPIHLPPPELIEARWPGGSVPGGEGIRLPAGATQLDLDLDIPHGTLPLRPRLQARMEGLDGDFQDVPPEAHLQYRNLAPGDYRLLLRASLDGSEWSTTPPIPIAVAPAWHQRLLFRAALVLAALGALAGIFTWRYNRLAEEAKALELAVEERTHAIARQNRALEQAHEQIRRTLQARLQLLDTLAHDLRSPLTSIMLAADRVRDGVAGQLPDLEAPLFVLDHEAKRIENLVRSLLNQRRGEVLESSLAFQPVTPQELLGGLEGVLRIKAEARDLTFRFEPEPASAFVPLRLDVGALQQSVFNLFENALKFTPAGGTVGLRTSLDPEARIWRLTIWDTGRGIPAEARAAILQPFHQVTREDASEGWGLGLSIVKGLMEAHHGRLELESEVGRGSAFTLALPLPDEAL